jgi:hypothetical protein
MPSFDFVRDLLDKMEEQGLEYHLAVLDNRGDKIHVTQYRFIKDAETQEGLVEVLKESIKDLSDPEDGKDKKSKKKK